MVFLVLLTVFYQTFAWEKRVTAQHSCYCDTNVCSSEHNGKLLKNIYVYQYVSMSGGVSLKFTCPMGLDNC